MAWQFELVKTNVKREGVWASLFCKFVQLHLTRACFKGFWLFQKKFGDKIYCLPSPPPPTPNFFF